MPSTLEFCLDIYPDNDTEVIFDGARLESVDPAGLCLLAAVSKEIAERGQRVLVENLRPNLATYLDRMDVFREAGVELVGPYVRHDRRDALVEVCRLGDVNEVDGVSFRLASALTGLVDRPQDFVAPQERQARFLDYVINELLLNALTHGRKQGYSWASVWVAAQYYPQKDRVILCVLDNGAGFYQTLRRRGDLNVIDDISAIHAAMTPGVSCNPDVGILNDTANLGIGLSRSKDITLHADGAFRAVTGSGYGKYRPHHELVTSMDISWNGSLVWAAIPRERLRGLDFHEILGTQEMHPGLIFH